MLDSQNRELKKTRESLNLGNIKNADEGIIAKQQKKIKKLDQENKNLVKENQENLKIIEILNEQNKNLREATIKSRNYIENSILNVFFYILL